MDITSHNDRARLRAVIDGSDLAASQKDVWHVFIRNAANHEVETIMLALQDDASLLQYLTDNLIQKVEVMGKKDSSLWQKIIEDEKSYIRSIKSS